MTDAEAYGIDLDELLEESFNSRAHFHMMREHLDRVREFELSRKWEDYLSGFERERQVAAQEAVERKALKEAEARPSVVKRRGPQKRTYEFTERQLEIARRSLGLA